MSKRHRDPDGLNWYLVTAIAPDGRSVSKFIVGYSKRSIAKKLKNKLKGTKWKYGSVRYLDSDVSEFVAENADPEWL